MNLSVSSSLLAWSAWAPGVSSHADWHAWASGARAIADSPGSPPVDFIPALQRRRLSRLSRLALATAHECAAGHYALPTIFASRHGEIHRTVGLLTELASHQPLSPMAFSLSVHNTASGLYAMAAGNTAPSTAIAAGKDTLAMALIEAVGQLQYHEQVMVVYAEEPLPAEYSPWSGDDDNTLLGLSLRLGRSGAGRDWQLLSAAQTDAQPATSAGLACVRWLVGQAPRAVMAGERCQWSLS